MIQERGTRKGKLATTSLFPGRNEKATGARACQAIGQVAWEII